MDFQKALGKAIREARLKAGLSRDDFSGVTRRSYMREIENGLTTMRVDKLRAIALRLGLQAHQLVLIAEAHMAGDDLSAYLATNALDLKARISAGQHDEATSEQAQRGMRGQKADRTRAEIELMYAAGSTRGEIARQLGISTRTVDRYKARLR